MNIRAMVQRTQEVFVLVYLTLFSKATGLKPYPKPSLPQVEGAAFCLSWRLAVEADNVRAWRTVPTQCLRYVETYMIGGQYDQDVDFLVGQILSYVNGIALSGDGKDAWILDVDDTCISNVFYYKSKRYGCDPYDPSGFKAWAMTGACPAIPGMLGLFSKLVSSGFKVFMVTGRDEETLGQVTTENLHNQGFVGYERLILRSAAYKGQGAVAYKSNIRKQLAEEGYKIWGNVGDQWSDLQGDFVGNRTFKLPNPMYFVP
ncbi:unnamed protein product [Prunus armeniaca]|uniref:Acid phosphatase n=1 Tax=Prunus armeniaca TaxID=36596 RepID=A0A6J5V7I4_PRUAR|nr:unnamed protein product [Prunus armeniaca]CAB4315398.1 unnamed protein product [Prunus armeniaca]